MATQNKPATTIRCGGIKATIWRNAGERGAFYSTTFVRAFKTADGEWRNVASFGVADLDALVTLATQAKQWIATAGPR